MGGVSEGRTPGDGPTGGPRLEAFDAHGRIVERVRRLLPVDLCAISLLEGGGGLRVVADAGAEALNEGACVRKLPPGGGVTGRAIAEGTPWYTADVLHDPRITMPDTMRAVVQGAGMRALLAVPLRAQGRVIGALTVADSTPRAFQPHEVTLLEAFADHAAASFDHARLATAAAATEARYRELFENASDIVFTLDLTGRLTSLNRAGERTLGYTFREAADRHLGRALVTMGTFESWIARLLVEPAATLHEVEVVARDGTVVPLEVSAVAIRAEGEPIGVQGIARDITERRRAERRFVQAQRMEALGQLAAGIAHDFNNFLVVVLGQSQLIEKVLDSRDPIKPGVSMIRGAAERAVGLTRQLLAFTRSQPVELQVLDLNRLITPLLGLVRPLLPRAVVVETSLAPDLGRVNADAGQIEQVVMNLILNARDAMPDGGRVSLATANVELSSALARGYPDLAPGPYVMLAVTDTGTGMTPEVKARAFEPFFTTKDSSTGTGLGLSTVYAIVTQHGGAVVVDSVPGQSTTFWIYLPRV